MTSGVVTVNQNAVLPHSLGMVPVRVVTVPTVLIICADTVAVIEHVGKADFPGHVVVELFADCLKCLIVSPR